MTQTYKSAVSYCVGIMDDHSSPEDPPMFVLWPRHRKNHGWCLSLDIDDIRLIHKFKTVLHAVDFIARQKWDKDDLVFVYVIFGQPIELGCVIQNGKHVGSHPFRIEK